MDDTHQMFFFRFFHNLLKVFRGYNVVWHFFAILITAALVLSGFDWWFFTATRSDFYSWLIWGAGIGGFFVPVLVPIALYGAGMQLKNVRLKIAGAAVAQASGLAWLVSSTYKAFTGRIQPEFLTYTSTVDISRDFNFGFWQHGIFWGWPSSHTAVAVAGAVALTYIYSNVQPLRYAAITYALFIAAGAGIGFHWFSDVAAGAIVGAMVGVVVGKAFRSHASL